MQPILRIDLSSNRIDEIEVPQKWMEEFLGGASLGARLLYAELLPELDPLSPQAPLLFLNGPLSGTAGPAVGRFVVCAKSPATGLWGESNCGGFWGPELRMAGYYGLWITGRADTPVYVSILNGDIEIRPASRMWGLETYTTQDAVKAELGIKTCRVAVIGPAGEAQLPFASILVDHGRMAGRTGMGAVMGSKNLKAIAVKGNGKVPVIDADKYSGLRSLANHELKADSYTSVLHELGSSSAADYFDYLRDMPKKYFQVGEYAEAVKVSGASMAESILVGTSACHACVIACGRVVRLGDGEKRKGPEYETLAGFGPNLLYSDLPRIALFGELCDRYGLDSISMSNCIGLVFKLNEMGLIPDGDRGSLSLKWGDADSIESLIHLTVKREGIGAWIAKGARDLAKHYGREEEAIQVNGLEVPYHDPRGCSGMALVYATSPRGACHNQSDYFLIDMGQVIASIGIEPYSRQGGAEKAKNVAIHQDWRTICNALVLCVFANVPVETVLGLVNAACGMELTISGLMQLGERAWNLKRSINIRLGLTGSNDKLPKGLLQPYQDYPEGAAGFVPDFTAMIETYYQARRWDKETGYPSKEKLISLGLEWLVEDIW
jgi:aldehyde:ferredoxin oxidoreductase